MEKLHAVHADERFDLIVLDTPPTTNALDFLDAPQKLVGAIDSQVMRWFVEQLEGSRGLSLLGRSAAYVFRGLAKFTGAAFLEQVGQFVTDINELFGGFRDRAQAVYDDLRSDDVAFVIVTSPAPLSVAEAVFFSRKLGGYGITPRGMVVNRVHQTLAQQTGDDPPPDGDALRAALAERLPEGVDVADLLSRMREAARDADALAARDAEGLRRLREHVDAEMGYTEVPALETDVHDLTTLATVGRHLLGPLQAG